VVGTKSVRETTEHFFNFWHGSEEYVTWRQERDENEGTTLGVPNAAEIVVALRGNVTLAEGQVAFTGLWGKEANLEVPPPSPGRVP
jgi:hypothetical protein